ncbi:hypothetical protein DIPPA_32487 [Diplonema papillatum]|nr:hypothetical protein DIPPA_27230 [Diplonema papillatum]KAJ9464835.1 hypothetical protein DIPPA_32487 [Diplonema papillatum]
MSVVDSLAQKYGFSPQAVQHLAVAVQSGNGACAQFNHPELGGMGQWARGGMLMIGDAFNHELKLRVSALCEDLAAAGAAAPRQPRPQVAGTEGPPILPMVPCRQPQPQALGFAAAAAFWPSAWGAPSSAGSQNDMQYAIFYNQAKLAIRRGDETALFDTKGHRLVGVSQFQVGSSDNCILGLRFQDENGVVLTEEDFARI